VRQLLDAFPWLGRQPYPNNAFVVSLEFHGGNGQVSLKTDLAITKWMATDADIVWGIRRFMPAHNLDDRDLISALQCIQAWPPSPNETSVHRFVGLGYEPDRSRHLNLYLEPPLPTSAIGRPAPRRRPQRSLTTALEDGLFYLLSSRLDGHWVDYCLPVGEADTWITAYVLFRLSGIAPSLLTVDSKLQTDESLDWLLDVRTPSGGWGYNQTTPDDADSTALAILALRRHNRQVPPEALKVLQCCLTKDGSVATYPISAARGTWTIGATEVTAATYLAVEPEYRLGEPSIMRQYIENCRLPNKLWPSFWWLTPLYATSFMLELMADLSSAQQDLALTRTISTYNPTGAFETALLLLCWNRLTIKAGSSGIVAGLLSNQRHDGSWPASAYLRLTNTESIEPWNQIDSGPIFLDQNATLTTATVLQALGEWAS
jgi:hypothetical protein